MLARNFKTLCQKTMNKYLSTVPLQKTETKISTTNSLEGPEKMFYTPDYFKVHNLFTVKDLFDAKIHYGHKTSSLNDKMMPFVFGSRLGHIIFDLDKTTHHLKEALNFAAHIAFRDGIILFVSRNPRMTLLVEQTAIECKEYALTREWSLGTFTDSESKFGCITRLPDLCILLNTLEESGAPHPVVSESAKMCIPTIGIVDSNCDPNLITYPIPGNDDSLSSFILYCNLFKEAILRGKEERRQYLEGLSKADKIIEKKK